MSLPKSVVKFSKNGVTYTSSVDKASYLITELTRAALRDVGRYISRTANSAAMKLPGMAKSKRVRGKTSAFQYWVRKKEGDLQVGIKHDTWYGVAQELGSATRVGKGGKAMATQPKKVCCETRFMTTYLQLSRLKVNTCQRSKAKQKHLTKLTRENIREAVKTIE